MLPIDRSHAARHPDRRGYTVRQISAHLRHGLGLFREAEDLGFEEKPVRVVFSQTPLWSDIQVDFYFHQF